MIKKISTIKPVQDLPDQQVIEALKDMLKQAEDGSLQSIALSVLYVGGESGSAWAGMGKDDIRMLGELDVLKRDIQDCLIVLRVEIEE